MYGQLGQTFMTLMFDSVVKIDNNHIKHIFEFHTQDEIYLYFFVQIVNTDFAYGIHVYKCYTLE